MSEKTVPPVLAKILSGIEGFDEITFGGLPSGRTTLLMGGPGSGKTVLALQALVHGAAHHDAPGIFVAFEEDAASVQANARSFGWNIDGRQKKRLYFLDAQLSPDTVKAGEFDLTALLAGLEAKAREIGAKLIVFDALDVLLTLLDNPATERRELYRIQAWLKRTGLTAIVTAKVEENDPLMEQRSGFMAFMSSWARCASRRKTRCVPSTNACAARSRKSARRSISSSSTAICASREHGARCRRATRNWNGSTARAVHNTPRALCAKMKS